jgi:hypothetical protein
MAILAPRADDNSSVKISTTMKRASVGVLFLALLVAMATAKEKDEKKDNKSADLNFLVLKDTSGKPVRNASIVLHAVEKSGKQAKGGFELKTDSEGKTSFAGAPYGQLRIQVLAPGYQTFGEDYEINQPVHDIVIKLKPPQKQYSIYGDK